MQKVGDGYLIAVYREGQRRIPSFEEVKEQVKALYQRLKTLEWMEKHKEELAQRMLNGKLEAKAQEVETLAFNLMQNFGIPLPTLLEVLEGKRYITVKTGKGLVVIKILSLEASKDIPPEVKNYYRLMVRNSQYLKKLQEVLREVYRKGDIEIKVNRRLIESL